MPAIVPPAAGESAGDRVWGAFATLPPNPPPAAPTRTGRGTARIAARAPRRRRDEPAATAPTAATLQATAMRPCRPTTAAIVAALARSPRCVCATARFVRPRARRLPHTARTAAPPLRVESAGVGARPIPVSNDDLLVRTARGTRPAARHPRPLAAPTVDRADA